MFIEILIKMIETGQVLFETRQQISADLRRHLT